MCDTNSTILPVVDGTYHTSYQYWQSSGCVPASRLCTHMGKENNIQKSLRIVSKKSRTIMVLIVRDSIPTLMAKNKAISNASQQSTTQYSDVKSIQNSS